MTTPPRSRRDNVRAYAILAMLVLTVIAATASIRASRDAKMSSQQNRRLLEERARNDEERTSLITEVRDQGKATKAQGEKLEALAQKQAADSAEIKRAVQAAEKAAGAVADCFKPAGECTKAAKRSQDFIEGVGKTVVAQVGELRFIVTEIRPGVFEATQAPIGEAAKPCVPAVQLGDLGIGQGVLCRAG